VSKHDIETTWTDSRGAEPVEREIFVKFSCGDRGCRYGYFDPISGDGEGPSGPEIEIDSVEIKGDDGEYRAADAETSALIEAMDSLYEKMVEIVDSYDADPNYD